MKNTKKILLVDDDETILKVLADRLESEGFTVTEARDGFEGLNKALAEQPDLILLDIMLPKMDGLTMFKKLREDKRGKNIPAIVLTILREAEKVSEALENGVYTYLIKMDVQIEDVVRKVKEKLKM